MNGDKLGVAQATRLRALKKLNCRKNKEIWDLKASLKVARGQNHKYTRGRKKKNKVTLVAAMLKFLLMGRKN